MPTPHLSVNDILEYIKAFNARDYAKQHSFYSDDVQLIIPDPAIGVLKGSDAIKEHYKPIHANAVETVIPIIVLCDRGKVYLEMEAYFLYKNEVQKAVHDYHVYPRDVIKITNCAVYDVGEGNKMERITCHLYNQELLGQVDVKTLIKDSQSRADPDLWLFN